MPVADIIVTPSSGNVFADLGFAEPELELAKADLAIRVQEVIKGPAETQLRSSSTPRDL